jgi:hypothetical protein
LRGTRSYSLYVCFEGLNRPNAELFATAVSDTEPTSLPARSYKIRLMSLARMNHRQSLFASC